MEQRCRAINENTLFARWTTRDVIIYFTRK